MKRKLRFLFNQLEKAGIEPRPASNVEAPDSQDMIDLEVRSYRVFIIHGRVQNSTSRPLVTHQRCMYLNLPHILPPLTHMYTASCSPSPHTHAHPFVFSLPSHTCTPLHVLPPLTRMHTLRVLPPSHVHTYCSRSLRFLRQR